MTHHCTSAFSLDNRIAEAAGAIVLAVSLLVAGCDALGGGDTTAPSVPSGVSAASGSGTVELEWSASEAGDLDGYNVYRATGDSVAVENATPVNSDSLITAPSFSDSGVDNGTTYGYRVTAVDDSGNESAGSSRVRVTPFADPPTRP